MEKKLIYEIVMPNFPRVVRLSESRRAKYYLKDKFIAGKDVLPMECLNEITNLDVVEANWGNLAIKTYKATKKLPARTKYFCINPDKYKWKEHKKANKKVEIRLWDIEKKEYVIKNPSVAGTPNDEIINGQSMYNGTYHPHTRDKIMKVIHEYMIPFLKGLEPITTYPLIIEGYMYDYVEKCTISKGRLFDIGNRQFPYNKAFEDMLQHCGIIKQDDVKHIIGAPRLIFVNLDNTTVPDKYCGVESLLKDSMTRTVVYQIYQVL